MEEGTTSTSLPSVTNKEESLTESTSPTNTPSIPPSIEKPHPTDVQLEEKEGKTWIVKTYKISSDYSPEALIEEPVLGNVSYQFQYLKEVVTDNSQNNMTKLTSKTITVECTNKELSTILKALEPIIDYEDDDGYVGQLRLDTSSIYTEAGGKTSEKKVVKETVTYTDLPLNDPYLIEKSITKNGDFLTLTDISWKETAWDATMPIAYKATCVYIGTTFISKTSGYTATGTYVGEVSQKNGVSTQKTYQLFYAPLSANASSEYFEESNIETTSQVPSKKQTPSIFLFVPAALLTMAAVIGFSIFLRKKQVFKSIRLPKISISKKTGKQKKEKTRIYMPSSMKPVEEDEDFYDSVENESSSENFLIEEDPLMEERYFTAPPTEPIETNKEAGFRFDPKKFMEEDNES